MKRLIILVLLLLLFSGCTKNYINDSEGQIPLKEDPPTYRDGIYFATYSHHNNDGYRGEMNLTIREGIITKVDFREISLEGKDKISDLEYYEAFKAEHNLDLRVLYTRLYNSVIRNQGTQNLPSTGDFPDLSNQFRFLCENILYAARDGNTATIILPMNEVYVLTGEPDEEGYVPTLKVTYVSDSIISTAYSNLDPFDEAKESREDVLDAYRDVTGLELDQVYADYSSQILRQNSLDPVDAIAGATETADRINELLDQLAKRRLPYDRMDELEKAE